MLRDRIVRALIIWVVIANFIVAGTAWAAERTPTFASSPVTFEPNLGQTAPEYEFLARRNGMDLRFARDHVDVFVPAAPDLKSRVRIKFAGADVESAVSVESPQPGRTNYLRGNDPQRWIRNVGNFSRLRYTHLYPGIDLLFYGSGHTVEHDFIVAPGGDAARVRFALEGARRLRVSRAGDLEIELDGSTLRFNKPFAFQEIDGKRKLIPVSFTLKGDEVGFKVARYDRSLPLTIDPVLSFATYFDGSLNDQISAVATDQAGNIYVTGSTTSTDFPIKSAVQSSCGSCANYATEGDAYIAKLTPSGDQVIFSTYLGGNRGDSGSAIAVDGSGNIIVAGFAISTDFPHAGNLNSQSVEINHDFYFAASLKPDGSALNYSGTIGDSGFRNYLALAVDSQGNAYLAGQTSSAQFPTTAGVLSRTILGYPWDTTFVLKLDNTGRLLYSTAIPGTAPTQMYDPNANYFMPMGIAIDGQGNVMVAGNAGPGLPTTAGVLLPTFPDSRTGTTAGFLFKLNADASALLFATYVPGADNINAMAADAAGDAYVTGGTNSTTLPVSANAFQKTVVPGPTCTCGYGYVLKLASDGAQILAGSYLTGTTAMGNYGTSYKTIALDSHSNVILAGYTGSADFPLKYPFMSDLSFSTLGFAGGEAITAINSDLSSLLFGTFLHGDSGTDFRGVTVDAADRVIAVGETFSADFPTTASAVQKTPPPSPNPMVGYPHSIIAKLDLATPAASACLDATSVDLGTILVNTSTTKTIHVTNCGNAPLTIDSVQSSATQVVPTQSCGTIAVGNTCAIQLTFTPRDTSYVGGTLTFNDNGAIPVQKVKFAGKGGQPQLSYIANASLGDLLVGTQGVGQTIWLANQGDGDLIVSGVSVTGDFTAQNLCTSSVHPEDFCLISVTFAPTQAGVRTGTLTITSNAPGSPHTIVLTGNGLTAYPAPTITNIPAVQVTPGTVTLEIEGTNFFPASTATWNGQPRTARYLSQTRINIYLLAGDLATVGEGKVTVSNPAPGGGTSQGYPVAIYKRLSGYQFRHAVLARNSGLLYATTTDLSPTSPQSIVVMDPVAMTVVKTITIGDSPNHIAISDDGTLLYVGLDGNKTVAQLALPSGTENFRVALGNDPSWGNPMVANSLIVLPGKPHVWVVSVCGVGYTPCGEGIKVFDDKVQRPTAYIMDQLAPDSMVFVGNDATKLFASSLQYAPPSFYQFAIDNSGITLTQSLPTANLPAIAGGKLLSDGNKIYVSNGQIIDPATLTVTGTMATTPGYNSGVALDPANSRIYYAHDRELQAFDRTTRQSLGTVSLSFDSDGTLFRFGTNGFVIITPYSGVYFIKSSVTSTSTAPAFALSLTADAVPVTAGSTANYNVSVTPEPGFTGQVSLSCANLPQYASCTINPGSITLSGAAVPVGVAIATRETVSAAQGGSLNAGVPWLLLLPLFGAVAKRRKLGTSTMTRVLLVVAALGLITACGGGHSQPPTNHTTAPGTYTVTLNATSGTVTKSMNLTLVVR